MQLCFFGTYDPATPRTRLLKAGWEAVGGTVTEINVPIWPASRAGLKPSWGLALKHWGAKRRLMAMADQAAGAAAILVPYPGHFDMETARAVGTRLGVPVLFDPFLSLYDTMCGDRARVRAGSWQGEWLRRADVKALSLADRVLADTPTMAEYYARLSGLPRERFGVVPVGADDRVFDPAAQPVTGGGGVLFYGSGVPLHGVETILKAARLLPEVSFRLIGDGRGAGPANVTWEPAVAYEALPGAIAAADLCLGIFGTSEKARRVVPHKVYEAAAMGQAVLTADTPAQRVAFGEAIAYVPAGDARALASAIQGLLADPARRRALGEAARARYMEAYTREAVGRALMAITPPPNP